MLPSGVEIEDDGGKAEAQNVFEQQHSASLKG